MEFKCKCECGKRFKKNIEKPTVDQVAEEMYHGFLSVECKEHEDNS